MVSRTNYRIGSNNSQSENISKQQNILLQTLTYCLVLAFGETSHATAATVVIETLNFNEKEVLLTKKNGELLKSWRQKNKQFHVPNSTHTLHSKV